MNRREFFTLAGGAATSSLSCSMFWPLAAHAQSSVPAIGMLASESAQHWADRLKAFRQGLGEAGYVEGRSVAIEYRWAEGHNDRLPGLAAELVRHRVNLIAVLGSTPSVLAAKAATNTIPIVFRIASNPVDIGLVPSLSRPGGNITGVTTMGAEVGAKQLELLHELVPAATTIALMVNPTNPVLMQTQVNDLQRAARTLGLDLHVLRASAPAEFDGVFAEAARLKAGALVIGVDAFFNSRSEQLGELALRHSLPTVSPYREFAVAGGLMSYGGGINDASRLAGLYAGRILKGEKPEDLPVQQAIKLELILNLKTAKALGLTVPLTLQATADEVIE
jgi:putative tryptophan/tyrosine transport system substrate-binding protein